MNKYPNPTPEKHQRQARLRRLRQQLRDGRLSRDEYDKSVRATEKDYRSWRPKV